MTKRPSGPPHVESPFAFYMIGGKRVSREQFIHETNSANIRPFDDVADFMMNGDTLKRQVELDNEYGAELAQTQGKEKDDTSFT